MENFWRWKHKTSINITDKMIEKAESLLSVKLPKEYLELLNIQNGGSTHNFAYKDNKDVVFYELFGIYFNRENVSILDSDYYSVEWGLPEKQILISGDGHYWVTLDYREEGEPCVRWIDLESVVDVKIADNFSEFLEGLVYDR